MESFLLFSDCWTYDSLKDFRQISPVVQARLKQIVFSLSGFDYSFCKVWKFMSQYVASTWQLQSGLTFTSYGILEGFSPHLQRWDAWLGCSPFLHMKSILMMSAFMGAAIAFACFAGAATLARRREFLYLGGLLSSVVLIFSWLDFASKIFGDVSLFQSEIYFWLLVYMVVQTQVLITEIWIEEFGWKGTEEEEEEGDFGEELHSTTNKNAM
ncbi:hypothetical protein L2E82_52415 [Cichorium intybus]|nr:hypothetical protein L2E82_52415 [Cichorium intybus]